MDTAIRAERANLKIGITAKAVSWHCHIPIRDNVQRKAYCSYLINRNKIYIAKKYFDNKRVKKVYSMFMKSNIRALAYGIIKSNRDIITSSIYAIKGLRYGKKEKMKANKYSTPQDD